MVRCFISLVVEHPVRNRQSGVRISAVEGFVLRFFPTFQGKGFPGEKVSRGKGFPGVSREKGFPGEGFLGKRVSREKSFPGEGFPGKRVSRKRVRIRVSRKRASRKRVSRNEVFFFLEVCRKSFPETNLPFRSSSKRFLSY